jgi:hypothetical protein
MFAKNAATWSSGSAQIRDTSLLEIPLATPSLDQVVDLLGGDPVQIRLHDNRERAWSPLRRHRRAALERTDSRTNQRNGSRPRTLSTPGVRSIPGHRDDLVRRLPVIRNRSGG